MSNRLELVCDWRRRLADAEGSAGGTTNLRWLYQMQMRLYRFLLSCYGKNDWRADKESAAVDGERDSYPDVEIGRGKPARPVEKMRVVLTAIAKAQDHPAQAGPLQSGLHPNDWVAAASGTKTRVQKILLLLRYHGIPARIVVRGGCPIVEVVAGLRARARQLVADEQLRKPVPLSRRKQARIPAPSPVPWIGRAVGLRVAWPLIASTLTIFWVLPLIEQERNVARYWDICFSEPIPATLRAVWTACAALVILLIYSQAFSDCYRKVLVRSIVKKHR